MDIITTQPDTIPKKKKKGKKMKQKRYAVLSESDKNLLLSLHQFIYMDTDFIHQYIMTDYPTKKTLTQRLLRLKDVGYLVSFTVPIDGMSRPANIYTLTDFGLQNVEQLQGVVKWNPRWSQRVPPWYQHQLMLNRIVMKYTKQAEQIGLEVKEWIPEARATWQYTNDKTDVIKPDGILVFGGKGSNDNIGLFMELERSVAKRQNTIKKVIRYNDFLNRDKKILKDYDMHVGFEAPISDWRVLFIGGNEPNTRKTINDILSIHNMDIKAPILVASKADVERHAFDPIYHHILSDDPMIKKEL